MDCAAALQELGLYKESTDEYKKLFTLDYPVIEIIPNLSECLFQLHSPSKVIQRLEEFIGTKIVNDLEMAAIKFRIGRELEKRNYKDLALEFYEAVTAVDPEHEDVDKRIENIHGARTYDSRYGYLLANDLVTTAQLQHALSLAKKMTKSVEFVLMEQLRVKKDDILKSLSLFYNCEYLEYDGKRRVPYELLTKLKKTFLLKNTWVPLGWDMTERIVDIYTDDPGDLPKTDPIPGLFNVKKLNFFVGIREDITDTINFFFEVKDETGAGSDEEKTDRFDMLDIDFEEEDEDDDEEEVNQYDGASGLVVKTVDQLLITAFRKGASDIHVEPSPVTKSTTIRYRVDGVCQEITQLPNSLARGILSRLKIMSGLDISERRLPQDGKIKFKRKGIKTFELRLATLPTTGGFEDAVLRILAEAGAMPLDAMGMSTRNLVTMKKIIARPYGLVLVAGPTGSGKTTTLHASLGHINKPGIKIWTAEDPVEITQAGLRQVECRPKIGLNFARVMRAFLRADPDIIMIGEMRDFETASIGIEASLTGHLVFSTLHTNTASETMTRLLDMGLNPLNFSDAFLGVLAQRLVRKLCDICRKAIIPTRDEFDEYIEEYGQGDPEAAGIRYSPEPTLYRTVGCDACSNTGYKGRLGIHELVEGTKPIKEMIKKQAQTRDLLNQAVADGMTTLKQDGIAKVFQNLTDIKEVRRVCIE